MGSRCATSEAVADIYFANRNCEKCACHNNRGTLIRGFGDPASPVLFVVDRLSTADLKAGVFPGGGERRALDDILSFLGEKASDFYIMPPAACPPCKGSTDQYGRPLELAPYHDKAALAACKPLLHSIIKAVTPEIVVVFGQAAVKALSMRPGTALSAGRIHEVQIAGEIAPYTVPVMVTNSLSTLHRTPVSLDSERLWTKTARHVQAAIHIGRLLRGKYGTDASEQGCASS